MSIGACYYKLGKYTEAKKYFEESFEINSNSFAQTNALYFISRMKFDDGYIDEAEDLAIKQIEISCKENYFDFEALGYRMLGNIRFKNGLYEEALKYYNKAINVLNNVGDRTIKFAISKDIIDTYGKMNDKDNVITQYHDLYKEHVNHIQKDMQVKIEQIDLENDTDMIKKEVEKEKENNQKLLRALESVNSLNVELKQLHEEKNKIMDILAHDLRNPLQSILSAVSLMNSKKDDKIFRNEMSVNINWQAKRMSSLINRLLDYRSIEDGIISLNITEFNPDDFITKLDKNIRTQALKKDINIISEYECSGLSIKSDYELLYHAIKFSSYGTKVYFRNYVSGNKHIFEVEDEGPGFTDDDKRKLYTSFAKLSAIPTADENSTGLGLSIVKKLCDLLGAEIQLESEVNKGSKFVITIKGE
jgi:signal transduction histidine kinase